MSNFVGRRPNPLAAAIQGALKLIKGGPKASKDQSAINFVNPSVPSTRVEKARRDLMLAKRKRAGSEAKLNTTKFEIKQGQKDLTFDYMKKDVPRNKKAKGGRIGYKKGTPNPFLRISNKKKTNLKK